MILGKSNQSLIGHVTDCLTAMNARIDLDEPILKTVCIERLQVDYQEVLACLRYEAVMHDIGKATDKWQEEEAERIRTDSDHPLITHAIPSAYITAASLQLSRTNVGSPKHAAAMAIWGHHGQLHDQSAQSGKAVRLRLLPEGWKELSDLAQQTSGFTLNPFSTSDDCALSFMETRLCGWKEKLPDSPDVRLRFKALYCLMVALLRTCDTAASKFAGEIAETVASKEKPGGALLDDPAKTPFLYDWRKVVNADVLNGRSPYRIQQRESELNNLCDVLNAGCGEGKTAFALQHGQRLMQQGKINRIIFTLPTKFTSNNMHKDFRDVYQLPKGLVGLFHSDSMSFLKRQQGDEEKNSIGELQHQDKVYHRPITISTVDHLLMSFYHGYKYADWALGNILQSLIVFDELHHYETLTISAINEVLAILRLLRIPHLIMTATIPTTRINTLNHRLPGDPQLLYAPLRSDGKEEKPENENRELRVKEAFVFSKREERMVWAVREGKQIRYEVASSLLNDLAQHQYLRQIVFVNQVEKAKAIARAIRKHNKISKDCPILCYHAEYIGRDRDAKEQEIRQAFDKEKSTPCILIATQIAELSLDISADRMYSEIAPLDDIAQRGGRLHRNGITRLMNNGQPYEMIVYKLDFENESDVLPYVNLERHRDQLPGIPHLLERSWAILPDRAIYRFDNVCDWVDTLYDKSISLNHVSLRRAIGEDTVFGSKPQERYGESEEGSDQVILRAKEYETFDVVPQMFAEELSDNSDANRAVMLKINEFKFWKAHTENLIGSENCMIRVYKGRSKKAEYQERKYFILKRPYTYDYGVDFTGEPEFPTDNQPIKIPRTIF
ncbi:MAG: hypothetical protein JWL77_1119 [Chthonomonadaceae bacterium]|nr:hypothetical protein [Chthonomonadaceae bacterium]